MDEAFMRRAIALASSARDVPGASPIGCVIALGGQIVGEAHNEVGSLHDPTAHAEILAMRRACEAFGREDLRGAALYSTLQPCGMCSMASIWASVTRIVYGARRGEVHRMYFEDRHIDVLDIIDDAWRDDVRVRGGVLAAECRGFYWRPDDDPPAGEQANV